MSRAGIILCGGKGLRMGGPKATLQFGPETMLERMVRLVRKVAGTIVVVGAPEQSLPLLGPEVIVARDRREGEGPLEGLAAGLTALPPATVAAYVTGCDAPLFVPAFAQRLFAALRPSDEIAVPCDGSFCYPLAAVYRPAALGAVERLLAAGERRLMAVLDECATQRVPLARLREVDLELLTLLNCNRPQEYEEALRRAGLSRD